MFVTMTILIICVVIFYSVFSGAGSPRAQLTKFYGNYYAEDAVTDENDVPNSRESIEKCIENGLAIKTELFITKDRKVVVSAYNDLSRQYGIDKKISECEYDEIADTLMNVTQFIELVAGRVPVILELKTGINNELLCRYTADAIKASGYENIGVVSFHTGICAWFKSKEKKIFRGLMSAPAADFKAMKKFDRFITGNMIGIAEARPQFALYRNKPQSAIVKMIYKIGTIEGIWTITDKEEGKKLEESKIMIVCRGFMPDAPHYMDMPERQKSKYEIKDEEKAAKRAERQRAKEEAKNAAE
ncbi:MAG: hypothetical protein IKU54_07480 [Oscillospiraceae bacterium]|nr:hypothetical protein [Oscillospiraceae bacterium]